MTDLRKAAEMALDTLEWLSKNELPKKGAAKAELDEVVIPTLRQALAQPETEIERLKKEVEYLRQAYYRVKDENERLALDLGIRDNPQFGKPY
jgi:hypothetical protein